MCGYDMSAIRRRATSTRVVNYSALLGCDSTTSRSSVMNFRYSLCRLALFGLIAATACVSTKQDDLGPATSTAAASTSMEQTAGDEAATDPAASDEVVTDQAAADKAYRHRRCGRGIRACPASQANQRCDRNDPLFLCLEQSNGGFCCLPFAN